MTDAPILYMDFAATSAVRPGCVAEAMVDYLDTIGATPGRGGHRLAIDAARVAFRCRQSVARLLGIPGDTGRIAFMYNATHALNTALAGILSSGDAVVVTVYDHNAVLRPVAQLERTRAVEVRTVPGDGDGTLDMDALARALEGARMLVINAGSNVLGTTLDAEAMTRLAHDAGALVLVDTAQTAGHVPFDTAAVGADLVAFTGHKAMLGPQGTGGLWARAGVDVVPLLSGGTGGNSLDREMPAAWPDHLEAGTSNAPGIAGLAAGVDWVLSETVEALQRHTSALKTRLWDGLSTIEGLRVLSPRAPAGAPIVTVVANDIDPATFASRLDREFGILTRPGLHCAPEVHRLIGTDGTGAVRFSLGWSSTATEVDRAVEATDALTRSPSVSVGR